MIDTVDIQTLVSARFTKTISDSAFLAAMKAAVAFYSKFNPTYQESTMNIVEGTRSYSLPSDFMFMDVFEWWPAGEVTPSGSQDAMWDRVYRHSMAELRSSMVSPYIYFADGKLITSLTPEADESVEYSYYGRHVESSGQYSTIPDEDLILIVDLVSAEILIVFGTQAALDPDFAEGLMDLRMRSVSGNVVAFVHMLQAGVKAKYGGY